MADTAIVRRRHLVPEVLQNSDWEGGAACLMALLAGYDLVARHRDLVQFCEREGGGHSFEALRIVAARFGMEMQPTPRRPEFALVHPAACLPAIAKIESCSGATRCVVLWRGHGPWLQVMDPSCGRLWIPRKEIAASLQILEYRVHAQQWDEWSQSEEFTKSLEMRARALGERGVLWPDRAHQDAALRLAEAHRRAGELGRGRDARRFLELCAAHPEAIPHRYWGRRPEAGAAEQAVIRGASLLAVCSVERGAAGAAPSTRSAAPPCAAIAGENAPSVWAPLLDALGAGGWLFPGVVVSSVCAAAFGTVVEALLFRGWFDIGRHLQSTAERLGAVAALTVFLLILLALDWPAELAMYHVGRRLELRLRSALLTKIPRTRDAYFQNRRIADLAFRAHWLYSPRQLPETVAYTVYLIVSIVVTGAAIMWVYPGSAVLVGFAVLAACGVPMVFLPRLEERDLRYRECSAALGVVHLDSLLGSRAIQAHGAQDSLQAAHALLLRDWTGAGLRLQVLFVQADALQMTASFACVIALVYRHVGVASGPAGLLLLIYWAISIPLLGRELATSVRSIPGMRTTLLRFRELMGSAADAIPHAREPVLADPVAVPTGVKIDFDDVCVDVGGQRVLHRVTLRVEAGEHVAIIGTSGAGKSSLVGCLLGWYRPASGNLRVDEAPLDTGRLA
jgi:ATP-binding cassette subfamily B protein